MFFYSFFLLVLFLTWLLYVTIKLPKKRKKAKKIKKSELKLKWITRSCVHKCTSMFEFSVLIGEENWTINFPFVAKYEGGECACVCERERTREIKNLFFSSFLSSTKSNHLIKLQWLQLTYIQSRIYQLYKVRADWNIQLKSQLQLFVSACAQSMDKTNRIFHGCHST